MTWSQTAAATWQAEANQTQPRLLPSTQSAIRHCLLICHQQLPQLHCFKECHTATGTVNGARCPNKHRDSKQLQLLAQQLRILSSGGQQSMKSVQQPAKSAAKHLHREQAQQQHCQQQLLSQSGWLSLRLAAAPTSKLYTELFSRATSLLPLRCAYLQARLYVDLASNLNHCGASACERSQCKWLCLI